MNISTVVFGLIIAFGFGSWPILARYSGVKGGWVALLAIIGSLLGAVTPTLLRREFVGAPAGKAAAIVLAAGVMNGVALYFYSRKLADVAVPAAQFVTVVCVLVMFWAPVFDWLLRGQVPSGANFAGYLCATAAVYLLAR